MKKENKGMGNSDKFQAIFLHIIVPLLCATLSFLGSLYGSKISIEMQNPNGDIAITKNLLSTAQTLWEKEEYSAAIAIYSSEELELNPVALTNLGYCYARGLGVDENEDTALLFYNKSNHIQARKNKLAIYLGNPNDTAIISEYIQSILAEDDIDLKKYIKLCNQEYSTEAVDLDEFCARLSNWERSETVTSSMPFVDTRLTKYEFLGMDYGEQSWTRSTLIRHYQCYRLKHIEVIEKPILLT